MIYQISKIERFPGDVVLRRTEIHRPPIQELLGPLCSERVCHGHELKHKILKLDIYFTSNDHVTPCAYKCKRLKIINSVLKSHRISTWFMMSLPNRLSFSSAPLVFWNAHSYLGWCWYFWRCFTKKTTVTDLSRTSDPQVWKSAARFDTARVSNADTLNLHWKAGFPRLDSKASSYIMQQSSHPWRLWALQLALAVKNT